jgi:branched-chain amino acid aminotransferase
VSNPPRIVAVRAGSSVESLDVLDRGFHYGEGLFETLRTFGGVPRLLEAHLARLAESCRRTDIDVDLAAVRTAVADALAGAPGESIVRIVVSRGSGPLGPDAPLGASPTVVVAARPLTAGASAPCRLRTRPGHPSASGSAAGLKATSYLGFTMARSEARAVGADEVLFLDDAGLVLEAATANVFAVTGGVARTPRASAGILPGIARALLLDTGPAFGVVAREDALTVHDLYGADEVFLTNAVRLVVPVGAVDGRSFPAPGPVTAAITRGLHERLSLTQP